MRTQDDHIKFDMVLTFGCENQPGMADTLPAIAHRKRFFALHIFSSKILGLDLELKTAAS